MLLAYGALRRRLMSCVAVLRISRLFNCMLFWAQSLSLRLYCPPPPPSFRFPDYGGTQYGVCYRRLCGVPSNYTNCGVYFPWGVAFLRFLLLDHVCIRFVFPYGCCPSFVGTFGIPAFSCGLLELILGPETRCGEDSVYFRQTLTTYLVRMNQMYSINLKIAF